MVSFYIPWANYQGINELTRGVLKQQNSFLLPLLGICFLHHQIHSLMHKSTRVAKILIADQLSLQLSHPK